MLGINLVQLAALAGAALLVGCGGGGGGGGGSGGVSSPPPPPPPPAVVGAGPFILVDQFGYLPDGEKVAVIRDPVMGFDAADAFAPGAAYQVVDAMTHAVIFTGAPTAWNAGATDASSGDRVWWFDFSSVTAPGAYEILDVDRNVRSARFEIGDSVYRPIMTQAMRMFYYQRAGLAKDAAHAGAAWADGAAFMGPLQDTHARLYSAPGDAGTERDLHGGWFDAGDYNKYTAWGADDVVALLHAYAERPAIWTDDYNIPESGNGAPDILDEIKWEMDWLIRMQNADGSLLSIVGEGSASPPSAVTAQSLYGPETTNATLSAAAAFALGAKVYAAAGPAFSTYAADLAARAQSAWAWAQAHPNVTFKNNDAASGSAGLGAGQQETDDYGRAVKRISAAVYLFALTGDAPYRDYVDAHYNETRLISANYAAAFEQYAQRMLLYYASLPGATSSVANAIRTAFAGAFSGAGDGWGALSAQRDPYRAFIPTYTWGSNSVKSLQGEMFIDFDLYALPGGRAQAQVMNAAAGYVHYLHGVNPLGKVYLSNMRTFGAENSVDQFFHTWFSDGSALWDSVAQSTYGPPPGYLVGGANPQYNWASGCPSLNSMCGSAPPSPPFGQPAQKSYADFNTGWPIDSWEVTEPDVGYQANYVLLLSKFVR
ncbi:MAG TPA: glycoside hydrolase family 9 protein [Caulobacterales bacterium]|nr:glycoside hydrolase family 9 protein [Caulobacterales bacterium]